MRVLAGSASGERPACGGLFEAAVHCYLLVLWSVRWLHWLICGALIWQLLAVIYCIALIARRGSYGGRKEGRKEGRWVLTGCKILYSSI